MSDDDYDLQALLELRENARDEAEQRYADEMRELERRREYVAEMRAELEAAVDRRESERERLGRRRTSGEASLAELGQFENYLRGMREDEKALRDEVERAEQAVDEQREYVDEAHEEMVEAVRQLEAVERHRDDWEADRARREKRRRASEMDDIATRIWREEQT